MRGILLAIVVWALATPAHADWYEASSDNFVIYADDSEKDVRKFTQNLERYHAALKLVTGRDVKKPSPSNRVTIFVVGGEGAMRKLSGDSSIAGFYSPRAGASKAFVQDIRLQNGYPHFSTTILLHEYAHHFLISSARFAMPLWMSEGAAEFFAAASFAEDGSVMVGRPARHRAGDLSNGTRIAIRALLDPDGERGGKGRNQEGFYGRAWLLYHYLNFAEERSGQLAAYWQGVASGMSSIESAEKYFGDLGDLERDLKRYKRQRRMSTFSLKPGATRIGPIAIRKLPEGEAKMMPIRIRSQRGVDEETAIEVLEDARKVALRYPNDPGVLTALAEAEFDAGNDDEAIAAADAAIAIDPSRANAYVQKGYALFRKAGDADDKAAAFEAAMAPFSALNKMENDHPLPLIYYYYSFLGRGEEPNETARAALEHAARLAPFDQTLWWQAALMQVEEGKVAVALSSLQPLAANPHGGEMASAAQALITLLADFGDGDEVDLDAFLAQLQSAQSGSASSTGEDASD